MKALGAQHFQLLQPVGTALLPLFGLGQKAQQPAGEVLHQRRDAQQHQRHDNYRYHSVCHGQVAHDTSSVGGKPAALQQQHHGGIQEHRAFVENVFQRHQACAGAQRQPGSVQVVQLHRHRTGTQRDHVAKGAAPAYIQPLPQGELRQTAAHDDPRHAPFQQGVADADRQHRQHLPH